MGFKSFFDSLRSSDAKVPHLIRIPDLNVLEAKDDIDVRFKPNTEVIEGLGGEFIPNEHYFTVRVNEMFLSDKRKWLDIIEPNVICLTNYGYGDQQIDSPFIVGRGMTKMKEIPEGMVFYNTRVAGIHPFIGGILTISLVLCQSKVDSYLTRGIQFIEKISGVFGKNISKLAGSYLEVSNIVIESLDKLFDAKALQPLFGFSKQFDIDAGDKVKPGYFALMEDTDEDWKPSQFFVYDNHLYIQNDNQKAEEFRKNEYVLFSLTKSPDRSGADLANLPFYKSYKKILEEIKVPEISQDLKAKIIGMLRVLNIEMYQSPDLTKTHFKELIQTYINDIKELMEPKISLAAGPKVQKTDLVNLMDEKIVQL